MQKLIAIAGVAFGTDREPDVAMPQPDPQRAANLQFCLAHDAPAAHRYQLNIAALKAVADPGSAAG